MQLEELEKRTSQLQLESDGLLKAQQALYVVTNSFSHSLCIRQCSRIHILRFFQISKKHDCLRFFEITCQKNVKSR